MTGAAIITGGLVPGVVATGGGGGATVYVPAGGGSFKAKLGGQPRLKARMDTP